MVELSTKPVAVVIIPTFNEVENIKRLVPALFSRVAPLLPDWSLKVLVVDSRSPDGTALVVEDLSRDYPELYLLEEGAKNGLGSAYVKGFNEAIQKLGAEVVIEFDADFQHPPETLVHLLNKIGQGFDSVMGSRKISGGSEPVGRNRFRVFLTDFGGLVARVILFFPGKFFAEVSDPTGGLRATRVKGCLDKINLEVDHFYSKKFGYKVQLLYEILQSGARYAEIPLRFENRQAGISKIEWNTAFEILWACLKTRLLGSRPKCC